MHIYLTDAKYVSDYKIWCKFNDGLEGIVDLQSALHGPMFQPLQNLDSFKTVHMDSSLDTIVWDNGADLDPEFLHELVLQQHTQI